MGENEGCTIRVGKIEYEKLLKLQSALQIKAGKKATMADAIKELFKQSEAKL
jgi:hypothetical protein